VHRTLGNQKQTAQEMLCLRESARLHRWVWKLVILCFEMKCYVGLLKLVFLRHSRPCRNPGCCSKVECHCRSARELKISLRLLRIPWNYRSIRRWKSMILNENQQIHHAWTLVKFESYLRSKHLQKLNHRRFSAGMFCSFYRGRLVRQSLLRLLFILLLLNFHHFLLLGFLFFHNSFRFRVKIDCLIGLIRLAKSWIDSKQ